MEAHTSLVLSVAGDTFAAKLHRDGAAYRNCLLVPFQGDVR
jgi:hypothetical protein